MAYVDGLDDGNNNGDDKRLHVRFHLHPRKDDEKSAAEGRPIFVDTEYVEITVPGDKANVVDRPAREQDKRRFYRQYEAFKNGTADADVGTPLTEWPQVTRSQVEELAYFRVKTVEQLAELSDGNARNIGPILALRQKARDWLEKAKGGAVESKLRAITDEQKHEIDALKAQIAELVSRADKAEGKPQHQQARGK